MNISRRFPGFFKQECLWAKLSEQGGSDTLLIIHCPVGNCANINKIQSALFETGDIVAFRESVFFPIDSNKN